MANEEHLAILRQGVEVWNKWREENPDVRPDLNHADLCEVNLCKANLRFVDLVEANLRSVDLSGADITGSDLSASNLTEAVLDGASLDMADLSKADLTRATLLNTYVGGALFTAAILDSALLSGTDMSGADLAGADLTGATIQNIIFSDNDLSQVKGLDNIIHWSPSTIGINTLYRSDGKIPEVFLRGCGVPDTFIEYLPSLLGAMQPIQFYSCFISYSTKDENFAKRLHERMRAEHLRVWFAPEDIKGGEKLHEQIERAIQMHDRLLLVLSEQSIKSEWVLQELRRARRTEIREQRRKLFPIRLMDFEALQNWECMDSRTGTDLAEEVRQYYIPDFTRWKEHDAFEREFTRLLRDLKTANAPPVRSLPLSAEPAKSKVMPQNPQIVIARKKRRLEVLEEQQAIKGISAPPEVVTEIEDLRQEIAELEAGQG